MIQYTKKAIRIYNKLGHRNLAILYILIIYPICKFILDFSTIEDMLVSFLMWIISIAVGILIDYTILQIKTKKHYYSSEEKQCLRYIYLLYAGILILISLILIIIARIIIGNMV